MDSAKNKRFNVDIVIFFYLLIIAASKVVRYTIMKSVLVDQSAGFGMLEDILYNSSLKFLISISGTNVASNNASFIFKVFNIFKLSTYSQFEIAITIIWNIFIILMLIKFKPQLTFLQFVFVILSIAICNIFNFNLSKEPIQMLFFFLIYIILKSTKLSEKKKNAFALTVFILSSLFYRSYYILVVVFSIYIYSVLGSIKEDNKKKNIFQLIACYILIGIFYYILLNILKHVSVDSFNELIRVRTRSGEAKTQIETIIPGANNNLILFCLDYLLTIVRLLIPVELLKFGPKYYLFIIYQAIITYYLIKSLKNINSTNDSQKVATILFLAFVFTSATFEPDFGSWVRHEAVAFPMMIFLTGMKLRCQNMKKLYQKNY